MHCHSATLYSIITRFLPKYSEKITVLPANAKFVSVGKIFFDKQPELDTRCENMTPLTVEDQLLIKTSQTGIGWIVEKK